MGTAEERLIAYRRTITIIVVIVTLYLSFLIIRPFLMAIAGAAVLAYLFYPIYKFLTKHIPGKEIAESFAAILTVIIIILIVLLPMAGITALLVQEARSGYIALQHMVNTPGFNLDLPASIAKQIQPYLPSLESTIVNVGTQMVGWLQVVLTRIPGAFFSVFITVFSIYFFLKGAKNMRGFLEEFFPLPEGRYKQIFAKFDGISRGMVLGQIVVGILHGLLAWFVYAALGVPNAVLWSFLTAVISIIPVLGSGLVWGPISLYLLITGDYFAGAMLLLYGFGVMSALDNFLKPKIIGDRASIHPLLVLFGIIGGVQLLGLPGILIGPLILALFDVVLGIFREVI